MSLKSIWNNLITSVKEKYYSIQAVSNKISKDFKDLFQYNAQSLDKMVYAGNGVVRAYDDVADNGKIIFNKLYKIKTDFNKLEDILFNRTTANYVENNIVLPYNPSRKPSKFKSAIISTIVGLGTMNYTYNNLRNTDNKKYYGTLEYKLRTVEELNKIIELKNKYFWKDGAGLIDIISRKTGVVIDDISSTINDAMVLKVCNPSYSALIRINYNSNIAPQNMKDEFINQYIYSEKTLKELSNDIEKKYGMYISSSTISRHSRKYLSSKSLYFKNRKEAKNYYKNKRVKK